MLYFHTAKGSRNLHIQAPYYGNTKGPATIEMTHVSPCAIAFGHVSENRYCAIHVI